MIVQFSQAFGTYFNTQLTSSIPDDVRDLRISLMQEELKEVVEAMQNEPIENIAKELSDLLYVTYGAAVAYGLQDKLADVFAEVHRSNMSKLDVNGKPIYREDGKVLKSELYTPADVKSVLES